MLPVTRAGRFYKHSKKCARVMELLWVPDHFMEWSYLVQQMYGYFALHFMLHILDI